jgi:hypothetical protein
MTTLNLNKLAALQYRKFVETDNIPSEIEIFLQNIEQELPSDYTKFLTAMPNTGIFEEMVACRGLTNAPCADDGIYPITMLYGFCSKPLYDLVTVQAEKLSDMPPGLFLIGNDDGGNYFCLDLGERNYGRVYFLFSEEPPETGKYLLADDFSGFIEQLFLVED